MIDTAKAAALSARINTIERARHDLLLALRGAPLPGTAAAYASDVEYCVQRIIDVLVDDYVDERKYGDPEPARQEGPNDEHRIADDAERYRDVRTA
jgi:hypothetical protein